jgi:hypothetical protein
LLALAGFLSAAGLIKTRINAINTHVLPEFSALCMLLKNETNDNQLFELMRLV